MARPEVREKLREANRKQFADPVRREKHRQACIAATAQRKAAQKESLDT